jgi:hypothetical protein
LSIAPNNNVLEMLQGYVQQLRQQSTANAQLNQLFHPLLAQLQQSTQTAATQDNGLIAALTNAIAQQSLPQAIHLQQQINQNQANSILQGLLAQQLVNQSMLNGVTSRMFTPAPAPGHDAMLRTLGASQSPLESYLNQNRLLNAYAATVRTGPSSEQALSLLLSNTQNSTTAASGTYNQGPGSTNRGSTEIFSSSVRGEAGLRPRSQSDSSSTSTKPQSQRKRKHPHPP